MNEQKSPCTSGEEAPSNVDVGMGIVVMDDVLPLDEQQKIHQFLMAGNWTYGWRSSNDGDAKKFWHQHFAGPINNTGINDEGCQYSEDVAGELMRTAPLLHAFWQRLRGNIFQGHVLSRCYANALPYGTEGGTHVDSPIPGDCTAVYYPHATWHPDWGGETVVFNQDCTDILTAVYPKPNRLFVFPGFVNHVARGTSRSCPLMRVTLMFKVTREK